MVDPTRQPTKTTPPAGILLFQWLFRGLLFLWGSVVLGLAVSVGATWLTTKRFDATGTPLGWVIQYLPVVFACGGVLLMLTIGSGMLGRQRESSDSHPVPSPPTPKDRRALIQRLHKEYHKQIIASLGEVKKMALALRWPVDLPDENFLPPPASILQAYNEADYGLLILGDPGAGKSTLLRELALALLERAELDADQPVPVIVNLSSWAIEKGSLVEWLVKLWPDVCFTPRLHGQYWLDQPTR